MQFLTLISNFSHPYLNRCEHFITKVYDLFHCHRTLTFDKHCEHLEVAGPCCTGNSDTTCTVLTGARVGLTFHSAVLLYILQIKNSYYVPRRLH